jgi:hypothetical protein
VNRVEILLYLKKRMDKPEHSFRYETAVETAIREMEPNLTILKMVLFALGDPNTLIERNNRYGSALLLAIRYSNQPAIDHLLKIGADPNAKADHRHNRTPLQAAVEQGNVCLVTKLLSLDVDVNSPPAKRDGATALQFAARKGYFAFAKLLLSKKAEVNAAGSLLCGRTALEEAAQNGRIDMIHLLVQAGANILGPGNTQFERAKTFATKNGYYGARRLLESLYAEQMARFDYNFECSTMDIIDQWNLVGEQGEQVPRNDDGNTTPLPYCGADDMMWNDSSGGNWNDFTSLSP